MAIKPIFDGSKWDSQIYSAKDALADRPPTKYIIDGVLPESSLSVVYGLPASYKTNLVIDAVICTTLNVKWLAGDSFGGFSTNQCPVLWIDADSGTDLLHERFGACLRAHGKNISHMQNAPIFYASFLDPAFVANDDASVTELVHRAKSLQAKIIVFDNLGTISGGVDENSPFMIPIMNRLRAIAARTGAAVIVIHHITKNGTSGNNQQRKTPRGHGSIEAAVDSAFFVEADDNSIAIQQTKSRRARIPAFGALFEYEHKPNRDLLRMKFSGIEPKVPTEYLKARDALVTFFKTNKEANQSTLTALIVKLKVGDNKARAMLDVFTRSNILQVKSGQARNAKLFQLNDPQAKINFL